MESRLPVLSYVLSRRILRTLWTLASAIVLGGSYWAIRASMGEADATKTARSQTFVIRIGNALPDEVFPKFQVQMGDSVTFVVDSDRSGELDIHGYEQKLELRSGEEARLVFTATYRGEFPLHLHQALRPTDPQSPIMHRHLGTLEVQ